MLTASTHLFCLYCTSSQASLKLSSADPSVLLLTNSHGRAERWVSLLHAQSSHGKLRDGCHYRTQQPREAPTAQASPEVPPRSGFLTDSPTPLLISHLFASWPSPSPMLGFESVSHRQTHVLSTYSLPGSGVGV